MFGVSMGGGCSFGSIAWRQTSGSLVIAGSDKTATATRSGVWTEIE